MVTRSPFVSVLVMGMVQSSCARPAAAKSMMPRTVDPRVRVAVDAAAWRG
jgi:hypothetical protein